MIEFNGNNKAGLIRDLISQKGNALNALIYLFSLPPLSFIPVIAEGRNQDELRDHIICLHYNKICGSMIFKYETPIEYFNNYRRNHIKFYDINFAKAFCFKAEGNVITKFVQGEVDRLNDNYFLVDREIICELVRRQNIHELSSHIGEYEVRSILYSSINSKAAIFKNQFPSENSVYKISDTRSNELFTQMVRHELKQWESGETITGLKFEDSEAILNLLQAGLLYIQNSDDESETLIFEAVGNKLTETISTRTEEELEMLELFKRITKL